MFKLTIMSFGYKHGRCPDANIIYDVRGFKNPYYDEKLRHKCGLDRDVYDYVFSDCMAESFFSPAVDCARISIDRAIELGKEGYILAFGCTGGQHRSVAFAKRAYDYFIGHGYDTELINRDCEKNDDFICTTN